MDLILVESPTKAKTLSKFLGTGYRIAATYGHIRDLPESKIGVDILANDGGFEFEPSYVQSDKQKERFKEIKTLASEAKHIFLATDPDREGEAIAWHVQQLIQSAGKSKKENRESKRIEFHEITKSAIDHALKHPREVNMPLVDAQQARRILDRIVGYKLSPLLWKKVRRGLSAGRVQSVALRLVVEKEKEIEAFVKVEFWKIFVTLSQFVVELVEIDGKKSEIGNAAEASEIERQLLASSYQVASVEKKEFRRIPPAPFTTSTLQQNAANKLGWSAKRTMQVAQSLYEEGGITYHRTDSTNISVEAIAMVNEFIEKQYGKDYLVSKPRLFKTKDKVAQEAHEAIRPTSINENIKSKIENLNNKDQQRLYELIWKRFVACQMAEVKGETLIIRVNAKFQNSNSKIYGLEARGETVSFDGWRRVYEIPNSKNQTPNPEDAEEMEKLEEQKLPSVVQGQDLEYQDLKKEQKFTQPPARYNDASLIKKLEEMGIGRPSTYAPTISTILDRQYVEKEEKRFKPTAIGNAVNEFLMANFSDVIDYEFTSNLEEKLDDVANGSVGWQVALGEFYKKFETDLNKTTDGATRVKIAVESTGEKCPLCKNGDLVVRTGKFGKFVSCSLYPECIYKANFQNKAGMKCHKCIDGDVILRKTKTGRNFYGCSNYPKCDFASWNKPEVVNPNT